MDLDREGLASAGGDRRAGVAYGAHNPQSGTAFLWGFGVLCGGCLCLGVDFYMVLVYGLVRIDILRGVGRDIRRGLGRFLWPVSSAFVGDLGEEPGRY